ncbi:uncharacterized protein LOC111640786 [Centruroides sculpturatus]|uniref:uncharacterized protein LOC111640786 n=1 Tax=Centruroides sculpturatus TaxID=218467 RepID=UPI000C6D589C|nr:uncharacterized protein LOC111640786 [Centruroides sculpturatus]
MIVREKVTKLFGCVYQLLGIVKETRHTSASFTTNNITSANTSNSLSYAEILKTNLKQSKTTSVIQKTLNSKIDKEGMGGNHALLVYPRQSEGGPRINMEEVANTIKQRVEPHRLGIQVKSMFKIKGDGICVRVGNVKDCQILSTAIEALPEVADKIECKQAEGKKPRLILLNVPNSIPEEDLIEALYEQNDIWGKITKEEVLEEYKVRTILLRGKVKENCGHVIISVPPKIRNVILSRKYMSLSWASVRVDDFISLLRCYKCCGYNHLARDCTNRLTCSHCGREHKYTECNGRHKIPLCINCDEHNQDLPNGKHIPTDHNAFYAQCQITQRLKQQSIKP